MNRQLEEEHFSLAQHTGVGIMAYSPLGIGLLSGAYDPKSNPDAESLWNKPERTDYYSTLMKGRTSELVQTVQNIAEKHNATPAQISLSWVLSHPEISVAISGADKEEQMKENVGALEIKLTEEQITDLNNKSKGLSYVLDGDPEENEL
jgi:aryl-alcohol dehydrogenase-like predicted oxidoreductase